MMTIKTFVCNPYQQNTYVVHKEGEKSCFIVDAGMYSSEEEDALTDYIRQQQLTVEALLITHAHPDHICGLERLLTLFPDAAVHMFSQHTHKGNNRECEKGQDGVIRGLSCTTVQVLYTPGHKEDCVCYYLPEEGILFSGDTLFYGSIGRTDLSGGNYDTLIASLHELMKLPADTTVYPGHGEPTTIAHEKKYNPYIF